MPPIPVASTPASHLRDRRAHALRAVHQAPTRARRRRLVLPGCRRIRRPRLAVPAVRIPLARSAGGLSPRYLPWIQCVRGQRTAGSAQEAGGSDLPLPLRDRRVGCVVGQVLQPPCQHQSCHHRVFCTSLFGRSARRRTATRPYSAAACCGSKTSGPPLVVPPGASGARIGTNTVFGHGREVRRRSAAGAARWFGRYRWRCVSGPRGLLRSEPGARRGGARRLAERLLQPADRWGRPGTQHRERCGCRRGECLCRTRGIAGRPSRLHATSP